MRQQARLRRGCRCWVRRQRPGYSRSRIKVRRPCVAAQMRSMSGCCPVGGRRRDGQVIRALSMGWRQCKSGKKCRGQRDCYGATENGNCQHTAAPFLFFYFFGLDRTDVCEALAVSKGRQTGPSSQVPGGNNFHTPGFALAVVLRFQAPTKKRWHCVLQESACQAVKHCRFQGENLQLWATGGRFRRLPAWACESRWTSRKRECSENCTGYTLAGLLAASACVPLAKK